MLYIVRQFDVMPICLFRFRTELDIDGIINNILDTRINFVVK